MSNEKLKKNNCAEDSIIALKILDQCLLEDCVQLGPVISDENCECIILECENSMNDFGRIILPGRPVCMPEIVADVKVAEDSFRIKNITILEISQSHIDKKYWDVQIRFEFVFRLKLFDSCMKPIKILCFDECCRGLKKKHINDDICCSVVLIKRALLFGGDTLSPTIASDVFPQTINSESPHALVEAKAFPLNVELKRPADDCCCEDIFDDIYDEPIIYTFITVGINAIIRLFRFQSILIPSCGYAFPKHRCEDCDDPCEVFSNMKFPFDLFMPPIIAK